MTARVGYFDDKAAAVGVVAAARAALGRGVVVLGHLAVCKVVC